MTALPQPITLAVLVCSAIVTFSSAATVIITLFKNLNKPEKTQNERLKAIEQRLEKFERRFYNDNVRLNAMEHGNKVTQEAILALLEHSIDGNNIEQLKMAKHNLHNYLLDRGLSSERPYNYSDDSSSKD